MRLNVGCGGEATTRLERRLDDLVEREGERAFVIGQSRGGLFARALGVRRPDAVRGVVTLGSPHRSPFAAVHPLIWAQGAMLAALGTIGVRGLATHRCTTGACCRQLAGELAAPVSPSVPFVSIYSRSDGIVDWRACIDPFARNVEVSSTHCGMGVNRAVYEVLDEVLVARSAARARRRSAAA
jgi:pimeloyl-ACP methyl ester carboxylesterase